MEDYKKPPRVSNKIIKRAIEKAENEEKKKSQANDMFAGTGRILDIYITKHLDSTYSSSYENETFWNEFYLMTKENDLQITYRIHVKYVFKSMNELYQKKVIVKSKLQRFEVIWSHIKNGIQMLFEKSLEIVIDRMISKMFHKNNSIFQRNCFSSFFSV